jgi:predicted nucleic acid-binding protein
MQLPDANIYLRFLLDDHPTQALLAKKIINKQVIYTDPTIIAEVIWALTSFYKLDKAKFIPPLLAIIDQKNNKSPTKNLLIKALTFFATHKLSYIDCYLFCLAKEEKISLATFDKKLHALG